MTSLSRAVFVEKWISYLTFNWNIETELCLCLQKTIILASVVASLRSVDIHNDGDIMEMWTWNGCDICLFLSNVIPIHRWFTPFWNVLFLIVVE